MILGPIDLPSNLPQQTLGTIENQSRASARAINSTNSTSGVQVTIDWHVLFKSRNAIVLESLMYRLCDITFYQQQYIQSLLKIND